MTRRDTSPPFQVGQLTETQQTLSRATTGSTATIVTPLTALTASLGDMPQRRAARGVASLPKAQVAPTPPTSPTPKRTRQRTTSVAASERLPDPAALAHTPQMQLIQASPVVVAAVERVALVLVGCGGTGSQLAQTLVHLARLLARNRRAVSLLFVDPDVVEEKNTLRQNFGRSEVGRNKAQTLARRYAGAFGLEIAAADVPISRRLLETADAMRPECLTLLFGCVDNSAARRELADVIDRQYFGRAPLRWWIDCGNTEHAGQVLVGNCSDRARICAPEHLKGNALAGGITLVPSPSLQAPTLLQDDLTIRADALSALSGVENVDGVGAGGVMAPDDLACEDMETTNVQSMMINKEMATLAGRTGLALVTGALKWMGIYDQPMSGLRTVVYTTKDALRTCGETC